MTPLLRNALTVDVEEHFQVTAFAPFVPKSAWEEMPSRVEANTRTILEIFQRHGVRGTFFVLGWVARRHPALMRDIAAAGHEVASHGFDHTLASAQGREGFREDVRRTRGILEEAAGVGVTGYRAASFSLAPLLPWSHQILREEGYTYSSSLHPIHHDLYGLPHGPRLPFRPHPEGVVEIPVAPVELWGQRLPAPGGGFFRLYPMRFTRWAIRRLNQQDATPAVFYCHPWEVDPHQPIPAGLGLKSRLRHTLNLSRTQARLEMLLEEFPWGRMDQVFAPLLG